MVVKAYNCTWHGCVGPQASGILRSPDTTPTSTIASVVISAKVGSHGNILLWTQDRCLGANGGERRKKQVGREGERDGEGDDDGRRGSYSRQKRRPTQPATMPEAGGPPRRLNRRRISRQQIYLHSITSISIESDSYGLTFNPFPQLRHGTIVSSEVRQRRRAKLTSESRRRRL